MGCGTSAMEKDVQSPPDMAKTPNQQANFKKYASRKVNPTLGILRLDYDYPPAPGDIDHPDSFGFEVVYEQVKGLTFENAQEGVLTPKLIYSFQKAVKVLEDKKVFCITGDCGFMMHYQQIVKRMTILPVFLSSLVLTPLTTLAYGDGLKFLVFTANGKTLKPHFSKLLCLAGVHETKLSQFQIIGCEVVPGFEAVAKGEAVPFQKVTKGLTRKVVGLLNEDEQSENPVIEAMILECTELPQFADTLRLVSSKAVFDAITMVDYYISTYSRLATDNMFGFHRITEDEEIAMTGKKPDKQKNLSEEFKLGVLTLDDGQPVPECEQIEHVGYKPYGVYYEKIQGVTYEDICGYDPSATELSHEQVEAVRAAMKRLCQKYEVNGITSLQYELVQFQKQLRQLTRVPVFLSALIQAPIIQGVFRNSDRVLVLCTNSSQLRRRLTFMLEEVGLQLEDTVQFQVIGCNDVPNYHTGIGPGTTACLLHDISEMMKGGRHGIGAIVLLEGIALNAAQFSDKLREVTGLPVFDVLTLAHLFAKLYQDNPRFGITF